MRPCLALVDRFLNIRLDAISVLDEARHPHMVRRCSSPSSLSLWSPPLVRSFSFMPADHSAGVVMILVSARMSSYTQVLITRDPVHRWPSRTVSYAAPSCVTSSSPQNTSTPSSSRMQRAEVGVLSSATPYSHHLGHPILCMPQRR